MLTEIKIKRLKPKSSEYTVSDANGLSIRILPTGVKTFQYRYHPPGQRRAGKRFTYGQWPSMSLVQARDIHRESVKKVRQGVDLNQERRLVIVERRTALTVVKAYSEYDRLHLTRLKTPEFHRRICRKNILPIVGDLRICDLTRRHIIAILDPVLARGAKIMSNRVLSVLKAFFGFCVEQGFIDQNPAQTISRKTAGGKEVSRNRCLSESEIKVFWTRLPDSGISESIQHALKILLLTGVRIGELLSAEWADVDLGNTVWTIPAANTKTGVEHVVPLSGLAAEAFSELKALACDSRWVLPSRISSRSRSPQSVNFAIKKAAFLGIEKWTPHDLRRTAATVMSEIGVWPHVVERCLNHAVRGIAGVYDRSAQIDEKRHALDRLAEKIKQIIAAEKAIPIRKAIEKKFENKPDRYIATESRFPDEAIAEL